MFYSFQSTYLDHFGRFRIQYLIVFNIVINWINSFVCLPAASLLVYTNTTVFCKLISYYVGMMDSFIISCNFWWNLSGFSTHSIMSSQKTESLILSLLIWMTFIYFCCLIAEASTSSTTLKKKKNGENGHSCYVSDFWGKSVSFFLIGKDFHSQHFVCDIYDIEVFSLYPYTRRDIFKKGCCVLSGRFSAFIERIICFLFFLILMWFITLMGLQILNHS